MRRTRERATERELSIVRPWRARSAVLSRPTLPRGKLRRRASVPGEVGSGPRHANARKGGVRRARRRRNVLFSMRRRPGRVAARQARCGGLARTPPLLFHRSHKSNPATHRLAGYDVGGRDGVATATACKEPRAGRPAAVAAGTSGRACMLGVWSRSFSRCALDAGFCPVPAPGVGGLGQVRRRRRGGARRTLPSLCFVFGMKCGDCSLLSHLPSCGGAGKDSTRTTHTFHSYRSAPNELFRRLLLRHQPGGGGRAVDGGLAVRRRARRSAGFLANARASGRQAASPGAAALSLPAGHYAAADGPAAPVAWVLRVSRGGRRGRDGALACGQRAKRGARSVAAPFPVPPAQHAQHHAGRVLILRVA